MFGVFRRSHLALNPDDWVFSWRGNRDGAKRLWLAILITTGVFGLMLNSLRIRLADPVRWEIHTATVMHVGESDPVGRSLYYQALEGGPFPSRFDPAEWSEAVGGMTGGDLWGLPDYDPELRELPEGEAVPRVSLAPKGEATLPKRRVRGGAVDGGGGMSLVPMIYPYAGLSLGELPEELPAFEGEVDALLTSEPWRFLVQLGEAGQVLECVSMAGGDEWVGGKAKLIVEWIRGIEFPAKVGGGGRWVAVAVGFVNRNDDGTDAR
ncbi:MAG: hypothetical protein ACQCXQ_08475 [Verrucomicrobiales bacterium]|nr:hypothetical protein [Verrucomicrobiota bacterium JB025]